MSPAPPTRTHSCGLKAAGLEAAERANSPSPLDPHLPPPSPAPRRDLPGSQPTAGLAQPCPGAAGRQRGPGTMVGIRDELEGVREAPGAVICSSAPSTVGCREAREPAARTPERAAGLAVPPRCEQSRGHSRPASGPADPHGGGRKGSSAPPLISFWKSTQNKEHTAVRTPRRHDNHWRFVPIVSTHSLFQCRI